MKKAEKALIELKKENFGLSNIEEFSKTYVFIKELKKFVESVESRAKRIGLEMMYEEDAKEISMGEYSIVRQEPTETKDYNAEKVIEALGIEMATPFLKIDKSKLDKFLNNAFRLSIITPEQLSKCQEDMKSNIRKGFIKLMKKK